MPMSETRTLLDVTMTATALVSAPQQGMHRASHQIAAGLDARGERRRCSEASVCLPSR
jgi:hypothetical protein